MTRFPRAFLFALLFAAGHVLAVGLPDTGQSTCHDDIQADSVAASNAASIARDGGTHPRQDCRYGRDAAAATGLLTKTGAGAKGFDYTKVANNGATLAVGAALGTASTDWACTKDNTTGLTWEVKTATSSDLRYFLHTYTWYNSDGSTNGSNAGDVGSNTCNGTLPLGLCNTQAFVTAVNAAALCTYTDWRMPTRRELGTLVYGDGSSPSIEPAYFPNTNTPSGYTWSGSTYAADPTYAWYVIFSVGGASGIGKGAPIYTRLVRGG